MKTRRMLALAATALLLGGCADEAEKKAKPTFMFWCFRKEIVSTEYRVPELDTPAEGAYLEEKVKAVPGVVETAFDTDAHTITVRYAGSTIRSMNIEEAIALAGFAVNDRPANPKAEIPDGIKESQ